MADMTFDIFPKKNSYKKRKKAGRPMEKPLTIKVSLARNAKFSKIT